MFYTDGKLQFPVRVERPNPLFARALQQAIGGVEGEIRVMMQYLFQAWGSRGPKKYRDMLLNTGTEEIGHIEMLSTAVALNLEGAPLSFQEQVSNDPVAGAVLNGMNLRHILSTGLRPVSFPAVRYSSRVAVAAVWSKGSNSPKRVSFDNPPRPGPGWNCRCYRLRPAPALGGRCHMGDIVGRRRTLALGLIATPLALAAIPKPATAQAPGLPE